MLACPSCGEENPTGFRFCGACAAPLPVEESAGVRKTVTVLFCDLVGSTSMGDRSDPELLREAMGRYHAELRTILERHGGTVEKFIATPPWPCSAFPRCTRTTLSGLCERPMRSAVRSAAWTCRFASGSIPARSSPALAKRARPDLFELRPAWAAPKPNASLVTLEPLATEDTEKLVDELHEVADETKARIVEAAEGNPLFVEHLLAMHAEGGNGELDIPPTLRALLAARIDRLEAEERVVIERASIEGRMFHRGSVTELLTEAKQPAHTG